MDIKLSTLNLSPGTEYTFTVYGHVDEEAELPGGSQIVFSNPNPFGPYGQYQWLVNKPLTNGDFSLEYKAVFSAATIAQIGAQSYFRIQTSSQASTVPIYIDNITVTARRRMPHRLSSGRCGTKITCTCMRRSPTPS